MKPSAPHLSTAVAGAINVSAFLHVCIKEHAPFVCAPLCECVCVLLKGNVMHTVDTQTSRGRMWCLPAPTIHDRSSEFVRPFCIYSFPDRVLSRVYTSCSSLLLFSLLFSAPLSSPLSPRRGARVRACSVAKTMQIRRAQDARAPHVPRPCHDHSSSPRPPPILHSRKYGTRLFKPGLTTGNVAAHA